MIEGYGPEDSQKENLKTATIPEGYEVVETADKEALVEFCGNKLQEWHEIQPDIIVVCDTSAVPIGFIIKKAWKKAYPNEEGPKFYRLDPRQVPKGKLYSRHDHTDPIYYDLKYEDRITSVFGNIKNKEDKKVIVFDETAGIGSPVAIEAFRDNVDVSSVENPAKFMTQGLNSLDSALKWIQSIGFQNIYIDAGSPGSNLKVVYPESGKGFRYHSSLKIGMDDNTGEFKAAKYQSPIISQEKDPNTGLPLTEDYTDIKKDRGIVPPKTMIFDKAKEFMHDLNLISDEISKNLPHMNKPEEKEAKRQRLLDHIADLREEPYDASAEIGMLYEYLGDLPNAIKSYRKSKYFDLDRLNNLFKQKYGKTLDEIEA